jgi:SAM-dependent methyltransferase
MAKLEYTHPAKDELPPSTETIEVIPWDLGGTKNQAFYIGSGLNFQASGNAWLEIKYTIEGAQIFYTRTFLHLDFFDADRTLQRLEELAQKGEGSCSFGSMLPETYLTFKAEKKTYQIDPNNSITNTYTQYTFEISADTGVVFGFSAPGERFVKISLPEIEPEEAMRFMRELTQELRAVAQGKHPDPASFPPGSSEWPLVWHLNQNAYNSLVDSYQEDYFTNPLLNEAFESWCQAVPPGGKVLDAGCGHGDPVISRLLEKGFQVTGADFSSEMLRKARLKYPQVEFSHQATTQLEYEGIFDGVCSFSSLLYLDPIDFYNAIYRINRALKPDGLLFLYAFDNGPEWRGLPFNTVLGRWMWSWHYGMEEAAARLEEHGYFKTLDMKRVKIDAKEEKRIARKIKNEEKKKEAYYRQKAESHEEFFLPYPPPSFDRPPYAYVIIARRKG